MTTNKEIFKLIDEVFTDVKVLISIKGPEYSGNKDRLTNFKRNAQAAGITPELVWRIYASKHWDALMQYESDIRGDIVRPRAESIRSRATDLITYLILFIAMHDERKEREAPVEQEPGDE